MDVKERLLFAARVMLLGVCAGMIGSKVVEAVHLIIGWM